MIDLSKDQKNVLLKIIDWQEKKKYPFLTLGGYAGTGKTTLIAIFRLYLQKKFPNLKVAFCSFTGKASRVLEQTLRKSNALLPRDSISTIHSLIYSPIENDREVITGWAKKDEIKYDLIISDEASMINKDIWNDLLFYKIPILAVGDHGQLPPINTDFNLMEKPMLKLETIHRHAENNPIVKLAQQIRNHKDIAPKVYSKNVKKFSMQDTDTKDLINYYLQTFDTDTLYLCNYNTSRIKINNQIRYLLGFEEPAPCKNDRVICLRNNHEKRIYNGMIGQLISVSDYNDRLYEVDIQFDGETAIYTGLALKEQFGAKESINFTINRRKTLESDLFDFGYALTVHKAQGSEAKRVILFEERLKHMDDDTWYRWLYTAITRAKEELIIFGD